MHKIVKPNDRNSDRKYQKDLEIERFKSLFPNQESVDTAIQMLDNVKVDFAWFMT